VKGFKSPVIFRRHDGRTAEVEAGPLRMRVPLADVMGVAGGAPNATSGTRVTTAPREERAAVNRPGASRGRLGSDEDVPDAPGEINVIGKRVEEANELVDKFIDDAALAGKPSVRIIHGYGTGALRRGIAEFLSTHPLVEKIRHEEENRGGQAVTIAELVR
jgi:DNA mismatch repair protein MutS2